MTGRHFKSFARGRTVRRVAGEMNGLEKAYAAKLGADPDVLWFKFEGIKFRLADKTFYSPDFIVMKQNGDIEIHETKGFWEQHAKIKIKVAADQFPFRFVAIQRKKKEWIYEEF